MRGPKRSATGSPSGYLQYPMDRRNQRTSQRCNRKQELGFRHDWSSASASMVSIRRMLCSRARANRSGSSSASKPLISMRAC